MKQGRKRLVATVIGAILALPSCDRTSASEGLAESGISAPSAPANVGETANTRVAPAPSQPILAAAGYDTIGIGAPPAEAEGYALADEGSYEDACRIYVSDRLPDAYAIVEGGRVMRLTFFDRPGTDGEPIRTDRDIGVGSTEAEVRAAYAPLREEPHHYVEAPAKDLFFGGSEREPGLRFEIGEDGRVSNLHAGLEPVLSYVEGCS